MSKYILMILIATLATPLWADGHSILFGKPIKVTDATTTEDLFGVTEDTRTPQEKEQDERESELRGAKYGVINKLHAGINSYCSLLGELIESASTEFTAQHHEGDSIDHDEIKELNELASMAHRQCDPFMILIKGRVL
ncbi:MAG: hypothetical protein OXC42_02545 [Gammaproteobacteria bacterium]|nr:hypothetical protein [Gammaproteobacteria bacterium]